MVGRDSGGICKPTAIGDWLAQTIAAGLPGLTMRLPEATYLAWLDCRALELRSSAEQFFLDRGARQRAE